MTSPRGDLLFLFNHGGQTVEVEYRLVLRGRPRSAREIVTGAPVPAPGTTLEVKAAMPPESVRVFRVDY